MRKIMLITALAALVGCSSVKAIGKIGDYDIYNASSIGFVAPSVSSLVAYDEDTNTLIPIGTSGDGSVAGHVLSAASVVGGAIIMGKALKNIDTTANVVVKP